MFQVPIAIGTQETLTPLLWRGTDFETIADRDTLGDEDTLLQDLIPAFSCQEKERTVAPPLLVGEGEGEVSYTA